jgi:hypothetical protein
MKNRQTSLGLMTATMAIGLVSNIGIGSFDPVDAGPALRDYAVDQNIPAAQPIAQTPYAGDPSCQELMSNIRKMRRVNVQYLSNASPNNSLPLGSYALASGTISRAGLFTAKGKALHSNQFNNDSTNINNGVFNIGIPQPFDVRKGNETSFNMDLNSATILLGPSSGTYRITCPDNKYAIVILPNTVITLLFTKTPDPIQIN